MPVMVVGADTPLGKVIVEHLLPRASEVRAFVSDAEVAASLKRRRVKVAFGDLSDASHLAAAGLNVFSAVMVAAAAFDDRPRSFAADPDELYRRWGEALGEAGVQRVIWVGDRRAPGAEERLRPRVPELAVVETEERSAEDVAAEVVRLDDAARL